MKTDEKNKTLIDLFDFSYIKNPPKPIVINLIRVVKFIQKRTYGRMLYYPSCDISRLLCVVFERKCLHSKHISIIENSDWKIEYVLLE